MLKVRIAKIRLISFHIDWMFRKERGKTAHYARALRQAAAVSALVLHGLFMGQLFKDALALLLQPEYLQLPFGPL